MTQVLELPAQTYNITNSYTTERLGASRLSTLTYQRVILVSPQPLLLVGLRGELNQCGEFRVVGEARNAAAALELVANGPVSLIIVDQARPGEAMPLIKTLQARLNRGIPMIVLGSSETENQVEQLRQIGISGFASKSLSLAELLPILRHAVQGRRPLPGIRAVKLDDWTVQSLDDTSVRAKSSIAKARSPLSPREIQILEVIAQGHSNKEVAQVLCISTHTLKNHLNNIFKKLDVEDRTQALMLGVRSGWIKL